MYYVVSYEYTCFGSIDIVHLCDSVVCRPLLACQKIKWKTHYFQAGIEVGRIAFRHQMKKFRVRHRSQGRCSFLQYFNARTISDLHRSPNFLFQTSQRAFCVFSLPSPPTGRSTRSFLSGCLLSPDPPSSIFADRDYLLTTLAHSERMDFNHLENLAAARFYCEYKT